MTKFSGHSKKCLKKFKKYQVKKKTLSFNVTPWQEYILEEGIFFFLLTLYYNQLFTYWPSHYLKEQDIFSDSQVWLHIGSI